MFVFGLKSLKLLENQETIKPPWPLALGDEVLSTFSSFPCTPTPQVESHYTTLSSLCFPFYHDYSSPLLFLIT